MFHNLMEKERLTRRELSDEISVPLSSMKKWIYEDRTLPKKIFDFLVEKYPELRTFTRYVEREETSNWGRVKGGINRNVLIGDREEYFRKLHDSRRAASKKVKHVSGVSIRSNFSRHVASRSLNPVPLIGVMLLTDGYVCKKGRYAEFAYSSKSPELTSIFAELVNMWKRDIILSEYTDKREVKTVYFHMKIPNEITKLSPTFKKSPKKKIMEDYKSGPKPSLDFLENSGNFYKILGVKLAMTSEGGITFYIQKNKRNISILPRIFFSCANPDLNDGWRQIMSSIGLGMNVQKDKNKWSGICGLATFDMDTIRRFREIVRFVDGVKISGKSRYCKGIEKNSLLTKLLEKQKFDDLESFMSFINSD